MASNSFKVKNSLVLTPKDLSTLTSPEAGDLACDINDANKIKRYDANASTWVEVGSGASGDVDTLLVQDFDSAILTSFTQTGLILDTSNPLNGTTSAKLIHQFTTGLPEDNQSFKQTIAVDPKFRGRSMTVALSAKSTASSGNVTILFRDETNNIDLQTSQQIIATSDIQTFQFGVTIPSDCLSFSYTITALPEAGSPETFIDDVVIRDYWMGSSHQGQSSYSYSSFDSQTSFIRNTTGFSSQNIIGEPTTSNGSGLYSYNSSNGVYTALTDIQVDLSLTLQTSQANTVRPTITVNGVEVGIDYSESSGNFAASSSFSGTVLSGQTFSFSNGVSTPTNLNIASVKAVAAVTKSVIVNDIVPAKALNGNASFEVPVVTSWQNYTPSFQGLGTPSNIFCEWRRVGDSIEIRGRFTAGTPTATIAQIGLPSSLTIGTVFQSQKVVGQFYRQGVSEDYTILASASQSYLTIGGGTGKLSSGLGTNLVSAGEAVTFTTDLIPVSQYLATKTETIGLTQSVLVEEADSMVRLDTANGYGSTNTMIRRFANLQQNIGSDILYTDSATLGASFTALKSGVYSISYSDDFTAAAWIGLSLNTTQPSTRVDLIPRSEALATSFTSTGGGSETVAWTGYLNEGDVIRAHTGGTAAGSNVECVFTMSRQGSLKKLNVSSDQKITIPTSELRFEGASSRGSVATAIVKFDTLAKIRGDAFTVESDSVLGTRITMKKAGKLSVSSTIVCNGIAYISLNQAVLTAVPALASEILTSESNTAVGLAASLATTTYVKVGDVIRVSASVIPGTSVVNNLNLSFQEQEIAVSVTNTLPQFSESDSSVRVDTANGYGSTGTVIRRFSNVRDNIGTDIEYVPSDINGDSFVAKTSGIYHISYTDSASGGNSAGMAITLNETSISTSIDTLFAKSDNKILSYGRRYDASVASTILVAQANWSGYLQAGDVIRAHTTGAAASDNDYTKFTISKVGKPNVTGVDVTPFVNVPQSEIEHFTSTVTVQTSPTSISAIAPLSNSLSKLATQPTLVSGGLEFTILRNSLFTGLAGARATNNLASLEWFVNGISRGLSFAVDSLLDPSVGGGAFTEKLFAGDKVRLVMSNQDNTTLNPVSFNLQALSDQILTAPETFSTDTASLQYAPSSQYTLSTLKNAPVGTFITFTSAANSNTKTQTTTAPSQTTSDMNVNGIQLFARSFSVASTASSPAAMAIQIGKGLKGFSLQGYQSTGKSGLVSLDYTEAGNNKFGFTHKNYNEVTGILYLDAAYSPNGANNQAFFIPEASGTSAISNCYVTINASKNVSLTGMNIERVSARAVNSSGQVITSTGTTMTYDAIKTFDTHGALNTATGVFTAPEAGYYQVNGEATFVSSAYVAGNSAFITSVKNGVNYAIGFQNRAWTNATLNVNCVYSDLIYLNKGDTLSLLVTNERGNTALFSGNQLNFFSITKTNIGGRN